VPDNALEKIGVRVDDGSEMDVHVARPAESGRHPGMLVFQEAFGVNAHIRDVAQRFAALGFVAAAPELFHRTARGFEGTYGDFESVRPHVGALKTEGLIADLRAVHALLARDASVIADKIACIGFCMGGRVSFMAAATVPLRAAISFYGNVPAELLSMVPDVGAPLLMFWGGLDRHIPPEAHRPVADALRAADKTFTDVEISNADHGFFCDARPAYNAGAAGQAWALVQEFLRQRV
jgi:carboxymethylenebutenolidase